MREVKETKLKFRFWVKGTIAKSKTKTLAVINF